jgi:hypothetical protein
VNFSGFVAWWLWRTIYLSKLPRLEKKVRVALDWTLDLCFAKDFACVTTPPQGSRREASVAGVLTEPAPHMARGMPVRANGFVMTSTVQECTDKVGTGTSNLNYRRSLKVRTRQAY